MGVSVHVPRQRNITYGQTLIWSIYNTRWPKHPHLPILWYKWLPHGPALWTHYMESWIGTDWTYTTSTSMSTVLEFPLTSWFPWSLRCRVKSHQVSDASAIIGIGSSALATISDLTQFHLPCLIWFDSLFPTWFDVRFLIWFDLWFLIWYDSIIFNWIWLMFKVSIFDSSHIIQVPFQSGFK